MPSNQKQDGDHKEVAADKSQMAPPTLSLPKGGGAIHGIGEKFGANPVTGTGSMTVPIATSPGRSGFGPQLSLSYDSGAGNGPFGFGWSLSIPSITRKTDKGLPRYDDAHEFDVFILSGAEDLVPVLVESGGQWQSEVIPPRTVNGVTYTIRRYRPRIEGLFARIERWTSTTGEMHWRSITRDNITTLYGTDNNSRIFDLADPDPTHPTRVFSWLICQSYDDKGNAIVYEYVAENDENIDRTQANERNRLRTANRYLKRIRYGNRTPNRGATTWQATDPAQLPNDTWMFEVVFDYDEDHYEDLDLDPTRPEAEQHRFVRASASPGLPWTVRPDPFSSHRAGFEVRTYRRCRRVLMFHHFDELGDEPYLVRSTEFDYADLDYAQPTPIEAELAYQGSTRFASFILAVTQSGFVRDETRAVLEQNGVRYVTYLKKSLPPLEFEYSKAKIQDDIRELDAGSLENLPVGLDGAAYQWVDLDGEGVSGILTEQADAWFYKPNLGEGRFGPLQQVAARPSLAALGSGRQQLLDLAGDGQLDLVALAGPTPGFFERTQDEDWESFRAFVYLPNLDWQEPNLRFVDLNGDGHADVLITEHDVFTWHPSLAEAGFGSARRVHQPPDEEHGPRLVLADGTQSIYLADMGGDGLTDLVRIRNGEVCYWPNMGYGRFGAKVTMDSAPRFDNPDQFDQRRVRLADIDGSGATDIIYLGRDGVRLYFNQSGNRWSAPRRLSQFPRIDNLSDIATADLLGNGTACLVWSSPLPGNARRPVRYIDLMGGQKPHLLVKSVNNLGAETHVQYVSSTTFYLADKAAAKPWITRLPFPVHVVERVETFDAISQNRFVTRYAYHHGYFDGPEREFRGFGMVEQFDTEEIAALTAGGTLPEATNIDATSHVPPVHTKTWFHTGVYLDRDHISNFFAGLLNEHDVGEYYREPGLTDTQARQLLLEDTELPAGLTVEEEREACRALKGAMLRQEVYALDGTDREKHPYTITEQNFTIERVQPRADNQHSVFFTHAREAISYHYERNPADPRVQHALTLEVDPFGNVLKSAAIGYGRREQSRIVDAQGGVQEIPNPDLNQLDPQDQAKQTQILITYIENRVTNPIADPALYPDDYRTPLPCETRTFELTGLVLSAGHSRFTLAEMLTAGTGALPLAYEQSLTQGVLQKRLIEHVRTLYRRNNLAGALPPCELQSLALPFESYKLAFTAELAQQLFVDSGKLTVAALNDALADEGKYVHSEGDANWWLPSGRMFFSPGSGNTSVQELAYARQHFFLPQRYRDPFHTDAVSTESFVTYDAYDLLMLETRDALGNTVHAQNDYRVLAPRLMTDPNGNRSEVAFDALGMVAGTAIMGKPLPAPVEGDSLDGFEADLTQAQIDGFYEANDPHVPAPSLLQDATTRIIYNLDSFRRAQEAHPDDPTQWLPAYAATLARETHVSNPLPPQGLKIQISFSYSDGFGREIQKKIQAEPGPLIEGGPVISPRWVGSGWTIFNNKGKPVRQYEPFFSQLLEKRHRFEFGVQVGVSPILFYDPVERVVATLHPNHTWEKVVFDPWQQASYDVNDTVLNAGDSSGPKSDEDVKGFFARLPDADYLPTWYEQRIALAATDPERVAADKAAVHRQTPTVAHADSLGRIFLTFADNGPDPAQPEKHLLFATRVLLDIEGNQREVIDAKDRVVMRYDYDMLGTRIHQASMEAGERWMLGDVAGKPLYAWDSRDHQFRTTYDQLRRPVETFLREGVGPARLIGHTVYGESRPNPEANNLRGKVVQLFDQAGVVTSDDYDFKGNLLSSSRELAQEYKNTINWAVTQPPSETFSSSTTYDALNRPTAVTAPDNSTYRPTYNEANLLDMVEVHLRGAAATTPFVTNINYDAKGQRELIAYGNGAQTRYEYDPLTFRLTRLRTTRPAGLNGLASQLFTNPAVVQDLRYTYDPAGNITRIADDALPMIAHDNQQVQPVCAYTYDAIYRLIEAQGREHIGQTAHDFNPPPGHRRDFDFAGLHAHPNDMQAMRHYSEAYEYDAVGNFQFMRHVANGGSWTRRYEYDANSLIEPAKQSNRLTKTTVGNGGNFPETYTYTDAQGNDGQGCITAINSMKMVWDFKDQLQQVDLGGGGTAYYVYDGAGQRVRKVIETQNSTRQQERIYLGGFEIYREYNGNGNTVTLERETLHLMDDKQRIALVETQTVNDSSSILHPSSLLRYQLGNHLGSASLELDASAGLISYEEYYPYGTTSFQVMSSAAEVSLKRYRYTGMERDEETGLAYHGARYYAPWLGRWVSCDPVGIEGGLNIYGFGQNNPVVSIDLSGQSPEQWSGGVTDIAEVGQNGLNIEKDNFWTYTDEAGNIWNLVDIYGEQQETKLKDVETKTGGGITFDVWSFWLFKREEVTTRRYQVPITTSRSVLQDRVWFKDTPEVIKVAGSAPKEEEDHWYSPWNLLKTGIELWSPAGKFKWVAQFGISWYENGSVIQAAKDVTIDALTDKVLGKTVDKFLGSGKKPHGRTGGGGGLGGKTERFERYGSKAEAKATTEAGGLAPRPGHETQPKWIGEMNTINPKTLGKRKNYTHKIEIHAQPGTRDWLKPFQIKTNEPGRYAIPANKLDEFNKRVINIDVQKRR
jgi:RHS repeat-associated protein